MKLPKSAALSLFLIIVALSACDLTFTPPDPTPPADPIETAMTPAPTFATPPPPSPSPSPSPSRQPRLAQATDTPVPGTPTETPTPTETLGPYEYIIQPNDTLYYIIQLPPWNYRSFDVVSEILRLNPNITSVDRLPPPGSRILIPRPTVPPTPLGYELTVAARPPALQTAQPEGTMQVMEVVVREGNTILGIAQQNNTTLSVLRRLNPQLAFWNCDFNNPSGGPNCNVPLSVGQTVNVPAPTPTPTLSPTFSGSETPLPTPTFAPPVLVFPPDGVALTGGAFQLQWVTSGVLRGDQVYLVEIEDQTAGVKFIDVTRSTSYPLPQDLVPDEDSVHHIRWRVSIAEPNSAGDYQLIGGEAPWRSFQWRGR
jgi:hypothetical protein